MLTRRLLSASLPIVSIATRLAATRSLSCVLCDEDVTDWPAHAASASHTARFAVCQELCAPERNAAMLSQLWDHIRLDFDVVDAATAQRVSRRRKRLSSTARYLRDTKVLQDCLLFFDTGDGGDTTTTTVFLSDDPETLLNEAVRVAVSFSKLVHVGERAMRAELMDRVLRLFPVAGASESEAILSFIMSDAELATIFDLLDLREVVYAATTKGESSSLSSLPSSQQLVALSDTAKRQCLLALIGEISLWNTRERPTSVASRADADTIVTHVLAQHVIDNVISESLHHSMQKVVDEGSPVWREFKDSVASLLMQSGTKRPNLSSSLSCSKEEKKHQKTTKLSAASALQQLPSSFLTNRGEQVADAPLPRVSWTSIKREGSFQKSVPEPENKLALFTPTLPLMTPKPKIVVVAPPPPQTPKPVPKQQQSHQPQPKPQPTTATSQNEEVVGVTAAMFAAAEQQQKKKAEQQQQQQQQKPAPPKPTVAAAVPTSRPSIPKPKPSVPLKQPPQAATPTPPPRATAMPSVRRPVAMPGARPAGAGPAVPRVRLVPTAKPK